MIISIYNSSDINNRIIMWSNQKSFILLITTILSKISLESGITVLFKSQLS